MNGFNTNIPPEMMNKYAEKYYEIYKQNGIEIMFQEFNSDFVGQIYTDVALGDRASVYGRLRYNFVSREAMRSWFISDEKSPLTEEDKVYIRMTPLSLNANR